MKKVAKVTMRGTVNAPVSLIQVETTVAPKIEPRSDSNVHEEIKILKAFSFPGGNSRAL